MCNFLISKRKNKDLNFNFIATITFKSMGFSCNPSNSDIDKINDLILKHTHIATHIIFVTAQINNAYIYIYIREFHPF